MAAEDLTAVLALLDERRDKVTTHRTRLVNQLHALLRDLIPCGAPADLTAGAVRSVTMRPWARSGDR